MADCKKLTILIVEDDEGMAELIKEKVEECGYETSCAYSAFDAVQWLSTHKSFIMLIDYTLPDKNAKEFISEFRTEDNPLPPFIISTGQGDERIAVDMMKLGARDYIVKDSQYLEMLPEIIKRVAREIENEDKRRQAEEALRQSEYRLKFSIEGFGGGTWEWNVQTGETIFNHRWAEIIGYTLEELMPVSIDTWIEFVHPDDLQKSDELVEKHFNGESEFYEFECRMKHKKGNWVWVLDRGKVIEWDNDNKPVKMFGIHMDITEKKEMYEKIQEISIHDALTNLFNRRYIFERLEVVVAEFIRENKNFTVSIIDIDHFKEVNDKYGHQAGDLILSGFAQIISSNLRPYDLAGRYGGEEFIIVSMNVSKIQTEKRIERILDIIRNKKFLYNENEIQITFSCGIAESLELDSVSVGMLIETADKRLYNAKNSGRNKVVSGS